MNTPNIEIFNRLSKHVVAFSKEYSAETKETLEAKLQHAKQKTIEHLSSLEILPAQVSISNDNVFYQLPNGHFAVKIDFLLSYYNLKNSTADDKDKISSEIKSERHHLKHFLHGKPLPQNGHRYSRENSRACLSKEQITAETQEDLIKKVKDSVWKILEEEEEKEKFNTAINVDDYTFTKTPTGYEANYNYMVTSVGKHLQTKKETRPQESEER